MFVIQHEEDAEQQRTDAKDMDMLRQMLVLLRTDAECRLIGHQRDDAERDIVKVPEIAHGRPGIREEHVLAHACDEQCGQRVADAQQIAPDARVNDLPADVLPPCEAEQTGNEQFRIPEMRERVQQAEEKGARKI